MSKISTSKKIDTLIYCMIAMNTNVYAQVGVKYQLTKIVYM